jgi:hypothetical protein
MKTNLTSENVDIMHKKQISLIIVSHLRKFLFFYAIITMFYAILINKQNEYKSFYL